MESKIILPNNKKIVLYDKEIMEFCIEEVSKFIRKDPKNRIIFDNFKFEHRYFNPYYDFLITVLKYTHEGCLIDKDKVISSHDDNYFSIKNIESNYNVIEKPLVVPKDDILHTDYYYLDHEGYIDDVNILLSITNYYQQHKYLSFIILLELSMMDYKICEDYLNQDNKDISDYLVNRLGFMKTTINKTVFYNK